MEHQGNVRQRERERTLKIHQIRGERKKNERTRKIERERERERETPLTQSNSIGRLHSFRIHIACLEHSRLSLLP